jgi:hypothetical protein
MAEAPHALETGTQSAPHAAGLQATARVLTSHLRGSQVHAAKIDVACCPGDQEWSCDCAAGRSVHPNKSVATGIVRQWIVAELPRGRSVNPPVEVPPDAPRFKVTLPDGESSSSGAFVVSYFDLPIPCPSEVQCSTVCHVLAPYVSVPATGAVCSPRLKSFVVVGGGGVVVGSCVHHVL